MKICTGTKGRPHQRIVIERTPLCPLCAANIELEATRERMAHIEGKIQAKTRPVPIQTLSQDTACPPAIICDIDGTLAIKGSRKPFDYSRVHEDAPNLPVIRVVRHFAWNDCYTVLIFSGRDEECRPQTERWLRQHNVPHDFLFMREHKNNEQDAIVKRRIFDQEVRGKFYVDFVLDDRNQVVDMWREIGLTCFQVAPGDF